MIVQGDCINLLAGMAPESCQMCVTSPPYYGLRDYKIPPTHWPEITFTLMAGLPPVTIPAETVCLGHEKSIFAFIAHTVHVFRGVHRVLKPDGTLWLNIADSYAGSGRGGYPGDQGTLKGTTVGQDGSRAARKIVGRTARIAARTAKGSRHAGFHQKQVDAGAISTTWTPAPSGVKSKELMGIPWMLAFALRADGWYLRQDIIWSKPNPMPESCKDRCTKAHEYLFLFSKSKRYYFDQAAIAEPTAWSATNTKMPDGWDTGDGAHGAYHREGREKGKTTNGVGFGHGSDKEARNRKRVTKPSGWAFGEGRQHEELDGRFSIGSNRNSFARTTKYSAGEHGQKPQHRPDREDIRYGDPRPDAANQIGTEASHRMGREPGWRKKGNRATFRAGGAYTNHQSEDNGAAVENDSVGNVPNLTGTRNKRSVWTIATFAMKEAHYATFPPKLVEPCIKAGSRPGDTVLDPFGGSGTVGVVAEQLGRAWVLMELSDTSVDIAQRRTTGVQKPLQMEAP